MAKQAYKVPPAWAGKKIKIVTAKKCVAGKFAEKKWKLVKSGMKVEDFLKLDTVHAFDKKNWARAELKHYIERKFVSLS